MKKLLFVYNVHAGKGTIKSKLADIIDKMVKAGYRVTVYPTQSQGDAANVIQTDSMDYDLVVCSGGDGMSHEIPEGRKSQK